MKDEEYLFFKDVSDKKRIAKGDYHKVRGGGRFVRFPSDNLTKKEREKMNGEVSVYNLGQPMEWAAFKSLSDDLACQYITGLRKRFTGLSDAQIALMMGVSGATISKRFNELRIASNHKAGELTPKKNPERYNEWLAWSGTAKATKQDIPQADESKKEDSEPIEQNLTETQATTTHPASGEITWLGTIPDIMKSLSMFLGGGQYEVKIAWESKE